LATLRFTPAALADLERLVAFLRESDPAAAIATIPLILDGLKVLSKHPLIGRPIDERRRELLIFRGRSGYVAQYAFLPAADEVAILALRHQRAIEDE
jgi:plasmid stabilization system protein ParE